MIILLIKYFYGISNIFLEYIYLYVRIVLIYIYLNVFFVKYIFNMFSISNILMFY